MIDDKLEIWVASAKALSKILDDIENPYLSSVLENKIVVVPLSEYNEVLARCCFAPDDSDSYVQIDYKAKKAAILTKALWSATYLLYNDDCGLRFSRDFSDKQKMFFPKVQFAFVLESYDIFDTAKYCSRKLEPITKQICEEKGIDFETVCKWPEVKILTNISRSAHGMLWCDFYG